MAFRGFAQALGDEFQPKGGNVLLGPGLNVHRVARNGRNVPWNGIKTIGKTTLFPFFPGRGP